MRGFSRYILCGSPLSRGQSLPQVRSFSHKQANLQFRVEPIAQKANVDRIDTNNHIIDLRGVEFPLNFVKVKLELEKIETGGIF